MPKQLSISLVLALALGLAACHGDGGSAPVTVTSVTVSGTSSVTMGSTAQLSAVASGSNGTTLERTFAWSSDNTSVATVDQSGLVSGVAVGTANISAMSDGKTGAKNITVITPPITTITFDKSPPLALAIGGNVTVTATARDQSNTPRSATITWTTSDATKVSISPLIGNTITATGAAGGDATLTASVGTVSATLLATVTTMPPPTITSISPSLLQVGSAATITGTNFAASPTSDVVTINGANATVTSASSTQLTITVPDLGCVPAQHWAVNLSVGGIATSFPNVAIAPALAPVSLTVGQVQVIGTPQGVSCLQFAASTSTRDYVVVATNASGIDDSDESLPPIADAYKLKSILGDLTPLGGFGYDRGITASRASSPLARVSRSVTGAGGRGGLSLQEKQDARFRGQARQLGLSAARALARSSVARRGGRTGIGVPTGVRADLHVGDLLPFRIPKPTGVACTDYDSLTAVVKAIGTNGVIVQDTLAPANGFTAQDFTDIETEFDSKIYPTDVTNFGTVSDIDGNGKVFILYTPRVNDYTPRGATSFVGGFFWAGDLFPRTSSNPDQACTQSNEGEIFYLLTPDPTGIHSLTFSTSFVRQLTRGTVAHEFQHMINASGRLFNPDAFAFESTWLDEALSHTAEELVGRVEDNFAPLQTLAYADVSANANDYNAFYAQNLLRLREWLVRPDTASANSQRAGPFLPHRGAAWSLVRFVADQYGSTDVPGFFRRVVAGPDTSLSNLLHVAGNGGPAIPYDSVLVGWETAIYTSGLGVPNIPASHAFKSWNLRDAESGASGGSYPLQVLPITSPGAGLAVLYRSGSAQYFHLDGTGGPTAALAFRLVASDGSSLATTNARLYVIRIH